MNTPINTPIEDLESTMIATNAIAIRDAERESLLATLKPIADIIKNAALEAENIRVIDESSARNAAQARDDYAEYSKQAETALRSFDHKLMDRIYKTHRQWTALLLCFTDPLDLAAKTIKQKIIGWQLAEAEKARREQARLQAEADERARKEQEKLLKQAEKLKTPELKEQRMAEAQAIVAPVVHVAAPQAAVKTQRRWKAVSVDKADFLKAAATNAMLHGFVTIEMNALSRSKAANPALEIPGVTFKQEVV